MTTIVQVRQALKPLLDRHSDLALIGRFLLVKPIYHVTRGVFVDRSIDKVAFVPEVVTDMLALEPVRQYGFWGWNSERLYDQSVGTWDVTKPDTVEAMRAHIEANVLHRLRSIASLDDYKTYENGKSKVFFGAFERLKFPNMMLAAAHGDFDAALQMWPVEYWFDQRLVKFFPEFHTALGAGDRVYIAKTLHRLEAAAARALGMEHIWESTPFPLEL
ncbi:hypothetical protein [Phyllobacterium zundukense]|jgi:hypothetical protein|uniref:Uncharacterized protein n=1 Tax=Phyllobacterium zundukense TaxID=1867719 RepID=A0ACD4D4I3_9HYPH|nr:hypothetical protein [Phyllobacterium zundukense]UXN60765.1 hypothetical protein N8E88_30560 [Phyllobacterium zundukense]